MSFSITLHLTSLSVVAECMLPGLHCLRHDLDELGLEHQEVVNAMVRDYQHRSEAR